jgi:hypothetical protein
VKIASSAFVSYCIVQFPLPFGERVRVRGVEHFFNAFFIYAREGNPYANVFFFC